MKYAIAIVTMLALAAGYSKFWLHKEPMELACVHLRGGVWATNGAICITQKCYETGTCRLRSFPAAHCDRLSIGDPISKVFLHLGEPMSSNESQFQWFWDKASIDVGVEAKFKNNRLVALDCKAFPLPD